MPATAPKRYRNQKIHIWVNRVALKKFDDIREMEGYSRDGAFERAMALFVHTAGDKQEGRRHV